MGEPGGVQLFGRVRRALASPLDRPELADILEIEQLRAHLVTDETPITFPTAPARAEDRPHIEMAAPPAHVGAWIDLSAIAPAFGRVLHRLARTLGGPVIEVGTGSGLSAAYLARGLTRGRSAGPVVTLDPNLVLARRAGQALATVTDRAAVVVVNASQEDYLDVLLARLAARLIHVDSNHTAESMAVLVARFRSHPTSVVVAFDDIRWSSGMESAWWSLCDADGGVAGAIDLGLWGVVVFDPDHRRSPWVERWTPPVHLGGAVPIAARPSPANGADDPPTASHRGESDATV